MSKAVLDAAEKVFVPEYRGEIDLKQRGKVAMFFVHRLRPEFSEDANGGMPNARPLLLVGALQIGVFFVLDAFVVSGTILVRFGIYRVIVIGVFLLEYLFLTLIQPYRLSFLYAYFAGLTVTVMIVLMTVELGGF